MRLGRRGGEESVTGLCMARYFPQSVSNCNTHNTNMEDFDKIQTAEFREAFDEFDKV